MLHYHPTLVVFGTCGSFEIERALILAIAKIYAKNFVTVTQPLYCFLFSTLLLLSVLHIVLGHYFLKVTTVVTDYSLFSSKVNSLQLHITSIEK